MNIFVEENNIIAAPIITTESISPTNPLPGRTTISNIVFRYQVGNNTELDDKLEKMATSYTSHLDIYLDYAVLKNCICVRVAELIKEYNYFSKPIVELEFMIGEYVDLRK